MSGRLVRRHAVSTLATAQETYDQRIAFTSHRVTDLARDRKFSEEVLQLQAAQGHGANYQEYDIAGRSFSVNAFEPENIGRRACEVAFEVDDFDGALERLRVAGIALLSDPVTTPVCRMAFFADPDGTPFTIHKRNPDRE